MIKSERLYLFECRKDSNADIGVLGDYSCTYRGENQIIKLTAAVDRTGSFVTPAVSNLSLGFTSMKKVYQTNEDIDKFIRSNKPFFEKFGEFVMLVTGTFTVDNKTGVVADTAGLNFFVPLRIIDKCPHFTDTRGEAYPALACQKVVPTSEIDCLSVNPVTYNAYTACMCKGLNPENTVSKAAFLKYLVFGEGEESA